MTNLLINANNVKNKINKKIYNLRAEKLIREASDNFIYFKDYEMALQQAETVLEMDAENVQAFILKGNIFYCLDELDTAFECFKQAVQIDPCCADAYCLKAKILDIHGQYDEALEFCEKAFKNLKKRDKDLLPSLYDQKISILIKLKQYKKANLVLKESYKNLNSEDCSYIASCYRDVINTKHREKKRKKTIAVKRLKLI